MPMVHDNQTLHLDVVAGPPMPRISVSPEGEVSGRAAPETDAMMTHTVGLGGRSVTLGRSSQCEIVLSDATISRRHASLLHRAGRWMITDLGSRHGSALNGQMLPEGQPTQINDGDTLALGPWMLRCGIGDRSSSRIETTEENAGASERVEAVPELELGTLAEQRLGLLLDCLTSIHQAQSETELATSAVEAALRGTGFARGCLARPVGGSPEAHFPGAGASPSASGIASAVRQVEILGAAGDLDMSGAFPISRTLLRAAAGGHVARLTDAAELRVGKECIREAVSVLEIGIKSAICAPIQLGAEIAAFLYLDTPHSSGRVERDAAAFCGAIAQVCGMALAGMQRRKIEEQRKQLENDLRVARDAQRRMMPPEKGEAAGMPYAMRSIPGRVVAGDLFDVLDLGDGRAAVLLGDVTGKGMGAAVLMAMTQSQLCGALREHGDPCRAVAETNRYLVAHSADTEFVSLWLGVIDPAQRVVRYIDAGHGYGVLAPVAGEPRRIESSRGLLVGIDAEFPYEVEHLAYTPGDRLILFSDGVVEQTPAPGAAAQSTPDFGIGRTLAAVAGATSPEEDVERVLQSLSDFAGTRSFNDDVTITSIRLS